MSQQVFDFLGNRGIDFVLHTHIPVYTVEEAKITRENIHGIHLKNLFAKDSKKSKFYLITAPADQVISLGEIRKQIKAKKLSLSNSDELLEYCGVEPGAVSFFNLLNSEGRVTYVLFETVLAADIVTFHPNENTKTIEITQTDFRKLLKEICPNYIIVN